MSLENRLTSRLNLLPSIKMKNTRKGNQKIINQAVQVLNQTVISPNQAHKLEEEIKQFAKDYFGVKSFLPVKEKSMTQTDPLSELFYVLDTFGDLVIRRSKQFLEKEDFEGVAACTACLIHIRDFAKRNIYQVTEEAVAKSLSENYLYNISSPVDPKKDVSASIPLNLFTIGEGKSLIKTVSFEEWYKDSDYLNYFIKRDTENEAVKKILCILEKQEILYDSQGAINPKVFQALPEFQSFCEDHPEIDPDLKKKLLEKSDFLAIIWFEFAEEFITSDESAMEKEFWFTEPDELNRFMKKINSGSKGAEFINP